MLKEISIPATRSNQNFLFFQGIFFFSIALLITFLYLKNVSIIHYQHPWSRKPNFNTEAIMPLFFFLFILWQIGKYLLHLYIYHFQLHSDVLIVVQKSIFRKKIYFFELKKITSVSVLKESKLFLETMNNIDYEINVLKIEQSNEETITYYFPPYTNYLEIKALKKILKDLLKN